MNIEPKTEKELRRNLHGPGGPHCPCCARWERKQNKPKEARYVRRRAKQDLRLSVETTVRSTEQTG